MHKCLGCGQSCDCRSDSLEQCETCSECWRISYEERERQNEYYAEQEQEYLEEQYKIAIGLEE